MENYAELLEEAKRVKNALAQETYQAKIDELGQRYTKLTEKRDELQASVNSHTLTDEGIAVALQYRDDVTNGMRNATVEDKRRILELLRVSVRVKDGYQSVRLVSDNYKCSSHRRRHRRISLCVIDAHALWLA